MSNIIGDQIVEFFYHSITRTFARESERLHDTHSRRSEQMERRHCSNDEIVFVDMTSERKEKFLHIPSVLSHVSPCISYEYKSESKRSEYDSEDILREKWTHPHKSPSHDREISRHLRDDREKLWDDIDHNDDESQSEKYHDDDGIGHSSYDFSSERLLISQIIRQREKCFLKHAGLFTTFYDSDFSFTKKMRKFSHSDIHRVSPFDEKYKMIYRFFESRLSESIMKTMKGREKCDTSVEEIGSTLIEESFVFYRDGSKKWHSKRM